MSRSKTIYTQPVIERIMFLREKCNMMPQQIAAEMTQTLGQPVHRRTISEITTAHGTIGMEPQYRLPHFDGWDFIDDNIEVDRHDREVVA